MGEGARVRGLGQGLGTWRDKVLSQRAFAYTCPSACLDGELGAVQGSIFLREVEN